MGYDKVVLSCKAGANFESNGGFCASYRCSRRIFMKLKISIALLLVLAPALASARPRTTSTRMRPQLFHDRTPKARVHVQVVQA